MAPPDTSTGGSATAVVSTSRQHLQSSLHDDPRRQVRAVGDPRCRAQRDLLHPRRPREHQHHHERGRHAHLQHARNLPLRLHRPSRHVRRDHRAVSHQSPDLQPAASAMRSIPFRFARVSRLAAFLVAVVAVAACSDTSGPSSPDGDYVAFADQRQGAALPDVLRHQLHPRRDAERAVDQVRRLFYVTLTMESASSSSPPTSTRSAATGGRTPTSSRSRCPTARSSGAPGRGARSRSWTRRRRRSPRTCMLADRVVRDAARGTTVPSSSAGAATPSASSALAKRSVVRRGVPAAARFISSGTIMWSRCSAPCELRCGIGS